ncbi:MAG: thermonuclease family protein, partial [Thermoleophilaceae bacterium]|nr:thermonuclease family protein [Thermoleophilaceae bacterium]
GTSPPPSTPPPTTPSTPSSDDSASDGETFIYHGVITKVVDGDTLKVKVKGRVKTVRAIGVDTPESKKPGVPVECGAKEATSAAIKWGFKKAIDKDGDGIYDAGKKGRKVTLKTDPTQDKTDKYGRLLAYVTRNGTNFARNQITNGWGMVYVYNNVPFKQVSAFQAVEARAKSAGRGVWGECDGNFHSAQ